MLRCNRLISAADVRRLELWVDAIENTALSLLGGGPPRRAVYHYADAVVQTGWGEDVSYFVGLMAQAVSDPATADAIEMILKALGQLGPGARSALPTLHAAEQRSYTWATPADLCTQQVRASIRRAITAIESE
jgi:hypothetical protein